MLVAQAQWTVWAVTSPSLACPSVRVHRAARLTACLTPQTPPMTTKARWTWWRKTKPSYPTAPWFMSNRFVHVYCIYIHIYSRCRHALYYMQSACIFQSPLLHHIRHRLVSHRLKCTVYWPPDAIARKTGNYFLHLASSNWFGWHNLWFYRLFSLMRTGFFFSRINYIVAYTFAV